MSVGPIDGVGLAFGGIAFGCQDAGEGDFRAGIAGSVEHGEDENIVAVFGFVQAVVTRRGFEELSGQIGGPAETEQDEARADALCEIFLRIACERIGKFFCEIVGNAESSIDVGCVLRIEHDDGGAVCEDRRIECAHIGAHAGTAVAELEIVFGGEAGLLDEAIRSVRLFAGVVVEEDAGDAGVIQRLYLGLLEIVDTAVAEQAAVDTRIVFAGFFERCGRTGGDARSVVDDTDLFDTAVDARNGADVVFRPVVCSLRTGPGAGRRDIQEGLGVIEHIFDGIGRSDSGIDGSLDIDDGCQSGLACGISFDIVEFTDGDGCDDCENGDDENQFDQRKAIPAGFICMELLRHEQGFLSRPVNGSSPKKVRAKRKKGESWRFVA